MCPRAHVQKPVYPILKNSESNTQICPVHHSAPEFKYYHLL